MTRQMHDGPVTPRLVVEELRVFKGTGALATPIVDGVSFSVAPGEAFALVGESGSGKSLTLKAIMGLLPSDLHATGRILLEGVDISDWSERRRRFIRGSEIALLMQDPFTCLNPLITCRRQLLMKGAPVDPMLHDEFAAARLEEVGLPAELADRYPYELSGGQSQRMAIAMSIVEHPGVLLLDEPTTALDVTTQKRVVDLVASLQISHEMSVVHVTHDMKLAKSTCEQIAVLYAGTLVERARTPVLVSSPSHPYSLGLMKAEPPMGYRAEDLQGLPGSVPPPGTRPSGCIFAPRCVWVTVACREHEPILRDVGQGSSTRCIRVDEIRSRLRQELVPEVVDHQRAGSGGVDIVQAQGLSKVFPSRSRGAGTTALDGVDMVIRSGECVGIVGESGSGKTTMGRILVGLEQATGGHAAVGGVDLGPVVSRQEAAALRDVVQMVFQNPYASLNPSLTIETTLKEAARYGGVPKPARREEAARLLAEVGLSEQYLAKRPSQLSGGERQRVTIARALARRPRLIVCDEVVSALDVSVQAQIITLMRDLIEAHGISLLFITHDLAVARQICDRLYVMQRGRVVEEGVTADVLDRPRHEYTRTLLDAVPGRGRRQGSAVVVETANGFNS